MLVARADAAGAVDWVVSVDSTINRAHQHATNLPRGEPAEPAESAVEPDVEVAMHVSGRAGADPNGKNQPRPPAQPRRWTRSSRARTTRPITSGLEPPETRPRRHDTISSMGLAA